MIMMNGKGTTNPSPCAVKNHVLLLTSQTVLSNQKFELETDKNCVRKLAAIFEKNGKQSAN